MKKYIIKSFVFLIMIFTIVSCRESVNNIKESVTETPIFRVEEQEIFSEFYTYYISMTNSYGNYDFEIISNNTTLKVNQTVLVASSHESIGDIIQIKITKSNGKYTHTKTMNGVTEKEFIGDTIMEVIMPSLFNK